MSFPVDISQILRGVPIFRLPAPKIDNISILNYSPGQFTANVYLYSQIIDLSSFKSCIVEVSGSSIVVGSGAGLQCIVESYANGQNANLTYPIPTTTDFSANPTAALTVNAGTSIITAFEIRCNYDIIRIGLKCSALFTSGYFDVSLKLKR